VPYPLPAVCLDISSAEAQLGQVHATPVFLIMRVRYSDDGMVRFSSSSRIQGKASSGIFRSLRKQVALESLGFVAIGKH